MHFDLQSTSLINDDFAIRAEDICADSTDTLETSDCARPALTVDGETTCHILEAVDLSSTDSQQSGKRITCLLRLGPQSTWQVEPSPAGCEVLLISGDLTESQNLNERIDESYYLRLPQATSLTFTSEHGCYALVKLGEMMVEDDRERLIDIQSDREWLPGPVEHTEVMPLHVHDERSVLLIRWLAPVLFKPQLDPQGEELFVIDGKVHDAFGSYRAGSWIRNPVPAWQAWGGQAGTLVYYKNGHFPD